MLPDDRASQTAGAKEALHATFSWRTYFRQNAETKAHARGPQSD